MTFESEPSRIADANVKVVPCQSRSTRGDRMKVWFAESLPLVVSRYGVSVLDVRARVHPNALAMRAAIIGLEEN